MGLFDQWNQNKFSIFSSQEKTVLALLESFFKEWFEPTLSKIDETELLAKDNQNVKVSKEEFNTYKNDIQNELNIERKLSPTGDFTGSWHGLSKPTLSDEGMRATVENINDVQIPSINETMKNNLEYAKNNLLSTIKNKKCIVSFVSDDGSSSELTKLAPLFIEKGVPYTLAVAPNLGGSIPIDYPTDLKNLQDTYGFEVVSHTFNHTNLSTLTEIQIENELTLSQNWLKDNGYKGYDILVYPQGGNNELVRKIARKYYKTAIGTLPNNGINEYPIRQYDVARVGLGSYFNTDGGLNQDSRFPSDGSTLDYYKARVDYAKNNEQWLIFMIHPWNTTHTETQQQYIRDLIDYIKSLNIPIMTISNALQYVGNTIDVGDYHYNTDSDYFVSSASGISKSSEVDERITTASGRTNLVNNYSFNVKGIDGHYSSNVNNLTVALDTQTTRDGQFSMKLTRLNSINAYAVSTIRNYERLKNKWVSVGAWVLCPNTNVGDMKIGVQDGVAYTLSENVPKDNKWHFIKLKHLVSANASTLQLNNGRVVSNAVLGDIMYIDSVFMVEGEELTNSIINPITFSSVDIISTDGGQEGTIAYNPSFMFICTSDNSWKRLQLINKTEYTSNNKYTPSTLLADFPSYTISVTPITTQFAIDNSFPSAIGGYLWTYKVNADNSLNYQIYENVNGVIYRRAFNSSGVAQVWKTPNYSWV